MTPIHFDVNADRKKFVLLTAPIFVCVKSGDVTRVVVADEETNFGSVARCLVCDRFWILTEEPEVGVWPHWEFGW